VVKNLYTDMDTGITIFFIAILKAKQLKVKISNRQINRTSE